MPRRRDSARPKRRYIRFTRWRRRRFFGLLAESGNVRLACELAGVGLGCIYALRRTEPGFVALMAAAVAKADRQLVLRDAGSAGSPAPQDERGADRAFPDDEDLVIRRGIGGRLKVMAAAHRWWTGRHDAIFFAHLRETANVERSARAAGFSKRAAYDRRARRPGFARGWEAALAEAEISLQLRVAAEAAASPPAAASAAGAAEPPGTFDPWLALAFLKWRARQRENRQRG